VIVIVVNIMLNSMAFLNRWPWHLAQRRRSTRSPERNIAAYPRLAGRNRTSYPWSSTARHHRGSGIYMGSRWGSQI